jgi:hypothetical protein
MPILNLDFLNKNQFRAYPFKASSTRKAEDSRMINNSLISACSITTLNTRTQLHVNQIFVQENFISLTIAGLENGKFKSLGMFHGTPDQNFKTLEFVQFERFVGGQLILGSLDEIFNMSGGYFFDPLALPLEESNVFYYTPPAVTSINYKQSSLRGHVRFGKLYNLVKTVDKPNKKISLAVQDNSSLASLTDHTSEFNNCKTPLIHYVNNSKPFYNLNNSTHQGNLYLVGVKPIIFYGVMGEGSLEVQTKLLNDQTLDLTGLCTARNKVLPPINPIYLKDRNLETPEFKGKNNFYGKSFDPPENIFNNSDPEFLAWPQFFKNFFKVCDLTTTLQTINIRVVEQEIGKLHLAIFVNTGPVGASVTLLKNTVPLEDLQDLEVPPASKVIKKFRNPVTLAEALDFSLVGSTTDDLTSIQVMLFYR